MISDETRKDLLKVIFKIFEDDSSEKVVHEAYQEWVAEKEFEDEMKGKYK